MLVLINSGSSTEPAEDIGGVLHKPEILGKFSKQRPQYYVPVDLQNHGSIGWTPLLVA